MPIPVTCRCGQSFAAGDHLAGRTVQCPKCKSPLTIPAPQAAAGPGVGNAMGGVAGIGGGPSIFDEAGMRTVAPGKALCPGCSAELLPGAVLCVNCGYHLQLGRRVGNQPMPAVGGGHGDGHGNVAQSALARAAAVIDEDKENAKKEYTEGMPWWAIAAILVFALTFLGAMLYLPGDQALAGGGITIAVVCGLVQLYHVIRILIIAFNDNIAHGLACFFCGLYTIVYSIMHWDECGAHLVWAITMSFIGNVVGWGMIAVAPYAKPGDPKDQMWLPSERPPVVLVMAHREELPRPALRMV